MADLFTPSIRRSAQFSDCETWRYTLVREWDDSLPRLLFILLNPSTADAENDDPTNKKGMGFARRWDFGSLVFVNLFAVRSPYPVIIKNSADPIGPGNNYHICTQAFMADKIVCAWGASKYVGDRARQVLDLLALTHPSKPLHHLGLTKDGHPKHPLYLPYSTPLAEWART